MTRKNEIEMYSIYNERKFVAAEWFTRNLKNKISKHMDFSVRGEIR